MVTACGQRHLTSSAGNLPGMFVCCCFLIWIPSSWPQTDNFNLEHLISISLTDISLNITKPLLKNHVLFSPINHLALDGPDGNRQGGKAQSHQFGNATPQGVARQVEEPLRICPPWRVAGAEQRPWKWNVATKIPDKLGRDIFYHGRFYIARFTQNTREYVGKIRKNPRINNVTSQN